MINNIVVVSDIHAGCQFGLCPPKGVTYDGGGEYIPSANQKKVWRMWRKFWDEWVPAVTKGEEFDVVFNGDAIDGIHHDANTQITHNLTRQRAIGQLILDPIVARCRRYYHIRGTESHVGKSGQDEEQLAKDLGAIPDENGNHARWEIWYNLHGFSIHFTHHIGGTQSSVYESTAVYKELVEAFVNAGRFNDRPPDVVVRSHRHRAFKVEAPAATKGISFVTPGWQLKTPYTYRLTSAKAGTPQFGGFLIRYAEDGDLYTRSIVWNIERPKEVMA
jgi:hypothetical protein